MLICSTTMDTWVNILRASCCTFLLSMAIFISSPSVHGRPIAAKSHEGTITTMKGVDGDVIDCIDIYKQPAFKHPLMQNHTLQMEPSSYRKGLRRNNVSALEILQTWHGKGKCPDGSIPIRRHTSRNLVSVRRPQYFNGKSSASYVQIINPHEYAVVELFAQNQSISGAQGSLNVWNPTVARFMDFTAAQLWVVAGSDDDTNTVQAGWHVNPTETGSYKTRFFTYWTTDNYQCTGCYNMDCPGFVQISNEFLLDGMMVVSIYDGNQIDVEINIEQDDQTGNWILLVQGNMVGYWPSYIFTELWNGADRVYWGGEIFDSSGTLGTQTITQMGSGHFPKEGYRKASYIRSLSYSFSNGTQIQPVNLVESVTLPSCYKLEQINTGFDQDLIYYGGPGCS